MGGQRGLSGLSKRPQPRSNGESDGGVLPYLCCSKSQVIGMATSGAVDSGDQVPALWQVALDEYLRDTGNQRGRLEDAAALRGIESIEQLADRLQASKQSFTDFRSHNKQLWGTLKQFASPLVTLVRLAAAAVGAESIGTPAAVVLNACVFLIEVCMRFLGEPVRDSWADFEIAGLRESVECLRLGRPGFD
jgi:hypothetical protein